MGHGSLSILFVAVLLASLSFVACPAGDGSSLHPSASLEELMDPASCQGCHPNHFREWSGSMHAYASKDPVFLAMNARLQRESDSEIGSFCVNCHAPMAVRLNLTTTGLNLAEIPDYAQGVTCYFCHSAMASPHPANNGLVLAADGVMRGGIADPMANAFHLSSYSSLHDRNSQQSSQLCGPCHDIVLPNGLELETTYQEWQSSLYNQPSEKGGLTCSACHMDGRDDVAANVADAPIRRVHSHMMPGVDIALDDFPERAEQLSATQAMLDTTLLTQLCVESLPGGFTEIAVVLENITAGHAWPSGSTVDRRAWVEVHAYSGEEEVFRTGVIGDQEVVNEVQDDNLWVLGHRALGANGEEAELFADAVELQGQVLPVATARLPSDPGYTETHVTHTMLVPGDNVDRVEMTVHIRPMALDVMDSLIESGDLDPSYRETIPTFELAASRVQWRAENATRCQPDSLR